jgi:hypothetical protein
MILYGFRAMFENLDDKTLEDYIRHEKSDYDVICTFSEFEKLYENILKNTTVTYAKPSFPSGFFIKTLDGNYDIHILRNTGTSNDMLYNIVKEEQECSKFSYHKTVSDKLENEYDVLNLDLLYLIKKSHLFIRNNFEKHMEDFRRLELISKHLKDKQYDEFYELRLSETLKRAEKYTNHINLNQCKDDFFDTKGVTYLYDHDTIHESVKLREYPAYVDILEDSADVLCSKEKWDHLLYERKMDCVLEEAYTIAIERYLSKDAINKKTNKLYTPHEAFRIGLEKICTTLCKGWFRKFACINYFETLERYDSSFVDKFNKALKDGKIKKFKGK